MAQHRLGRLGLVTGLNRARDLKVLFQRARDLAAITEVARAIALRLAARGANLRGEAFVAAAVVDRFVKERIGRAVIGCIAFDSRLLAGHQRVIEAVAQLVARAPRRETRTQRFQLADVFEHRAHFGDGEPRDRHALARRDAHQIARSEMLERFAHRRARNLERAASARSSIGVPGASVPVSISV